MNSDNHEENLNEGDKISEGNSPSHLIIMLREIYAVVMFFYIENIRL